MPRRRAGQIGVRSAAISRLMFPLRCEHVTVSTLCHDPCWCTKPWRLMPGPKAIPGHRAELRELARWPASAPVLDRRAGEYLKANCLEVARSTHRRAIGPRPANRPAHSDAQPSLTLDVS